MATDTSSFIGALAAASVAGFTVWVTHVFAERRDLAQAKVARNANYHAMLRAKLEQLVIAVGAEFARELEAAKLPYRYHERKTWTGEREVLPLPRPTALMLNETAALQELYFPELAVEFRDFINALSQAGHDWWRTTITEFSKQPDQWTPTDKFWDDLIATFKPASLAKDALLVRARAILVHNKWSSTPN